MPRALWTLLRWGVALLLLPWAAGLLVADARALGGLIYRPADTQYFLLGCAAYALLHAAAGLAPGGLRQWLYVLGHELTHAAAAWSSGFSVRGMAVSSTGGHVHVSRSNLLVALAPYVVPIYALVVVAAYRVWIWRGGPPSAAAHELFLFALGAALAFHWVFTVSSIAGVRQPDLAAAGGAFFSIAVIAAGNALVLLGVLKCLFPRLVSVSAAFRLAWRLDRSAWSAGGSLARRAYRALRARSS